MSPALGTELCGGHERPSTPLRGSGYRPVIARRAGGRRAARARPADIARRGASRAVRRRGGCAAAERARAVARLARLAFEQRAQRAELGVRDLVQVDLQMQLRHGEKLRALAQAASFRQLDQLVERRDACSSRSALFVSISQPLPTVPA